MAETFELNFVPHSFSKAMEFDFDLPETEGKYREALKRDRCPTAINDVRGRESHFALFRNGFQYFEDFLPTHVMEQQLPGMTEQEVATVLVPHTEELVRKMCVALKPALAVVLCTSVGIKVLISRTRTGSSRIITAGYRLRNLANDPSRHLSHHGPSHEVHCDFSPAGAIRFANVDLLGGQEPDLLRRRRMLVVNAWRPLRKATRDPLTVCDWLSISGQRRDLSCLVPWKVLFDGGRRQNESLKVQESDCQRWYYLKGQLPTELLLFLCFDSAAVQEGGMTVPHSAFVDPAYSDAAPRVSFEIKFFCFLDN